METRANYVLIGAFHAGGDRRRIRFVLWFQSLHTTKQRSPIRIVFEGPRPACAMAAASILTVFE